MAAEVTLKEESALEIGKQLAFSFQGLKNVGADTANGGLELEEEKQQTSYLETISGGIKKMVVFFGGLAASVKEARRERLITEAQGTEAEKEALGSDPERSFDLSGFKDKIKELTDGFKTTIMPVFGIFKGLFGKAMLFGLLLAFALNLNKFSDDLKPIVSKIVNGFKAAFTSLKEDFFPVIENFVKLIGSAFDTVSNILKIFEGDFSSFFEGIKGLGDIALRIVGIIGDAFFSLVDAVLKFFGIESQTIQDIKMAFRTFPEAVKNAVKAFVDFFVVDIPNKFNELKTAATDKFTSLVTSVKDAVTGFADSVINTILDTVQKVKDFIMAPIKAIKEKVSGVFSGVKDFFSSDTDREKANVVADRTSGSYDEYSAAFDRMFEAIQANQSDINKFQNETPLAYDMRATRASFEKGEDKFVFTHPKDPSVQMALAPNEVSDQKYKDLIGNMMVGGENNNTSEPVYNTPVIEPNEFMNNGGQLNKDSQEFASTSVMPPSMNVVTGGTTNTTSSNTTVTNIAESTTTSDMSVKKIFKTA